MISLPSVALTPGVAQTVQIPIAQLGGPVGSFKVANESPWALTISWAGNSATLAPWMADVFPAPGVQTFSIAVGGGSAYAEAEALVDVAAQGESFPGSYPVSLGQTYGQLQQRINPTIAITEAAAAGTDAVKVASPAYFQVADPVFVTSDVGPSQQTTGLYYIDGISGDELTFEQSLVYAVNPGDVVTMVPTVQSQIINSPNQPVQVTTVAGPPQDWQTPRSLYSKFQSWTGTTTILTPTVGDHFYLYGFSLTMTGTGPEIFLSASSSGQLTPTLTSAGTVQGSLYGYKTLPGETIQVGNAGTAGNATVILYYTQSAV